MRICLPVLLLMMALTVAACGGEQAGTDLPSVQRLPPPTDDIRPPVAAPATPVVPVPAAAPVRTAAPAITTVTSAGENSGWSDADYKFFNQRLPLYESTINPFLNMDQRTGAAEAQAVTIDQQRAAAATVAQQTQQLQNELTALQQQLAALSGTDGAADMTQLTLLNGRLTLLDQKLTTLDQRVQKLLAMRVSPQANWPH